MNHAAKQALEGRAQYLEDISRSRASLAAECLKDGAKYAKQALEAQQEANELRIAIFEGSQE